MAKQQAMGMCPIFSHPGGCKMNHPMAIGTSGDWGITALTGMALKDGDNTGFGVFAELPSSAAVLTAGQVPKAAWFDLYLGKAQTGDVSFAAMHAQLEVEAAFISGGSAIWASFENSGEVALTTGNAHGEAINVALICGASFSATRLSGIRISTSVNASATITDFAAITVDGSFAGSAKKAFDYIIDVQNEGGGAAGPAVAFARFTAVTSVIATTGSVSATQAGYILVQIGTVSKHIPLYTV